MSVVYSVIAIELVVATVIIAFWVCVMVDAMIIDALEILRTIAEQKRRRGEE